MAKRGAQMEARPPDQVCAHCGLPAGRTPDGEDLGELAPAEEHMARQEKRALILLPDQTDPANQLAHSGCVHALRVYRPDGQKPLAAGGFPRPAGGLTVHIFESRTNGHPEIDQRMTSRCGLEIKCSYAVEWCVVSDASPNLCPGCKTPRDARSQAFPALLPDGPRGEELGEMIARVGCGLPGAGRFGS